MTERSSPLAVAAAAGPGDLAGSPVDTVAGGLLSRGAEPPVGALARLKQCLPDLRGTSSRIGAFVLANPWEVRGLAINDLADRVNVSVNSVLRLTRELGFRGYREFAQALILDLGKVLGSAYGLPPAVAGGGPEEGGDADEATVVTRTLALEVQGLQDTIRHLDVPSIRRAVETLSRAGAFLFVGTGSGLAVCSLAAYRFTMLGLRAAWAGDPSTILAELFLLSRGDVLFAVSYHGAANHVLQAIQHARKRGVATICLTAAPGSPAARAADITLVTFGQDTRTGSGQFVSRVLTTALVEGLIAATVWKRFGGTPPHVEELLSAQREQSQQLDPPGAPRPIARQARAAYGLGGRATSGREASVVGQSGTRTAFRHSAPS